jgi:ribosomal-protein-alanine N-acetyltransferase
MSVEISAARAGSCALLARLHGLCFSEAWGEDAFAALLAMPGAFAFLACDESGAQPMPAGFALARAGGGECEIITLGVVPARRNMGAGAALLDAIMAQARLLSVDSLLLEVSAGNVSAIALYQSAAFVSVGRRKGYYRRTHGAEAGDGDDAIIMRRSLRV